MAEKNSTNQAKFKKETTKKGTTNSNNSQAEIVPWQNQEICIVDNVNQCRDLATKLRLYVNKKEFHTNSLETQFQF